mgnify:CR=1 FL=1
MTAVVQRSTNYTVAVVLNLALSLQNVVFTLPAIFDGADATNKSADSPPFVIMLAAFALGLVGLISSYGVWRVQRWGVVITIVVNALNFLSAIPGIPFAPNLALRISAILTCAAAAAIIWLLLRRRKAPALAGASA